MLQLTDVKVTPNRSDFYLNLEHMSGEQVSLIVKAGYAFFDSEGRLRAFTGIWEDGEVHTYKLLPISSGFGKEQHTMLSEIAGFLASFAVFSVAGNLRTKLSNGKTPLVEQGTFFTFNKLITPHIKSFMHDVFDSHEMGYYNVANGRLVFKAANGGFDRQ